MRTKEDHVEIGGELSKIHMLTYYTTLQNHWNTTLPQNHERFKEPNHGNHKDFAATKSR